MTKRDELVLRALFALLRAVFLILWRVSYPNETPQDYHGKVTEVFGLLTNESAEIQNLLMAGEPPDGA